MSRDKIKKWSLILFLSFFILYGLYESYKFLSGPRITIDEPKNGQIFENPLIEVKGTAKNVAFLKLNGRAIFVDKQGNFYEKILLLPGYNIMTLTAEDRFKKSVEEQMHFFFKGEMPEIEVRETASSTEKEMATTTNAEINN